MIYETQWNNLSLGLKASTSALDKQKVRPSARIHICGFLLRTKVFSDPRLLKYTTP